MFHAGCLSGTAKWAKYIADDNNELALLVRPVPRFQPLDDIWIGVTMSVILGCNNHKFRQFNFCFRSKKASATFPCRKAISYLSHSRSRSHSRSHSRSPLCFSLCFAIQRNVLALRSTSLYLQSSETL